MNKRPSPLSWPFWNNILAFTLVGAALSVYFQESLGGCSDYPEHFILLFEGIGIGAGFGILFNLLYPFIPNTFIVQPVILTLIRYYLAYVIFSYGFAKVFAGQFPHTMANMDARFAELTPMRVAWAFFGFSKGYQQFLGWGEVVPAVLLLFRRTTLIGALIMFVVMLNVFVVNIFFDVCVKINSGIYTALALYILIQEFGRLWNFFIANKVTGPRLDVILEKPRWLKISGLVVKYLLLGYILYTTGDGAINYYKYSKTHITPTAVQGAWKTVQILQQTDSVWRPLDRPDSLYTERLFFDGFNGVIKSDFIRDRFRFSIDSTTHQLTVNFTNQRNEWNIPPVTWRYEKPSPDSLHVWAVWKGRSLMMKCIVRKEKLTRY